MENSWMQKGRSWLDVKQDRLDEMRKSVSLKRMLFCDYCNELRSKDDGLFWDDAFFCATCGDCLRFNINEEEEAPCPPCHPPSVELLEGQVPQPSVECRECDDTEWSYRTRLPCDCFYRKAEKLLEYDSELGV